jgi:hypothetical protein
MSPDNRPATTNPPTPKAILVGVYGEEEGTFVLVGSDGYVALISGAGDVSAVSGWLAAIG